MIAQAKKITEESRSALDESFRNIPHLSLVRGRARLAGRDENGLIRILIQDNETLYARQVILNLGSETVMPDIPGLDSKRILFSENWLYQTELPKHLVIIGSGYIGVEMGQFYRRMGSEVTLLERGDQILGNEDRDVADPGSRSRERRDTDFKTFADKSAGAGNRERMGRASSRWKNFSKPRFHRDWPKSEHRRDGIRDIGNQGRSP